MFLYILIAIFSLVALMVFHELGHFLMAKKFKVKVEEFGIGIPPRIIGKKIGETLYSLNLLPIGAFVKIYGEDEKIKDERSFSEKTVFQRAMIILGGVIAFWIVAFFVFSSVFMIGAPISIEDDVYAPNAEIVIIGVASGYPAHEKGIMIGDIIKRMSSEEEININKAGQVSEFINNHQSEEIKVTVARKGEELDFFIKPSQDGMIGINFARTDTKKYPFHQSLWLGLKETINKTHLILLSLKEVALMAFSRKPLLSEGMIGGPVAIVGEFFVEAIQDGLVRYLLMLATLSIALAIFNLLPIPALDGGRFLLLIIEKIKGSPINNKLERNLIAFSFFLLVGVLILVTIYDIQRLT